MLVMHPGIVTPPKTNTHKKTLFPSTLYTLPIEMVLVENHWFRPNRIYLGAELGVCGFLFLDWFGGKRGTEQYCSVLK